MKKLKERFMKMEQQNKMLKTQAEAQMSAGQKALNRKIHNSKLRSD